MVRSENLINFEPVQNMKLKYLKEKWDKFGKIDPLWAILTNPRKKGNKWQIDEFFETGINEIETVIEHIESSEISIQNKKALDFGCGVGRLTQALSKYFDEIHGVDIAPSMIELANYYNRFGNKCKYHLNEEDNLEIFSDYFFDFIYSTLTLQHMKPKYSKSYIKEFLRILKPHGLLIFQIPSEPSRTIIGLIIHYIPSIFYDIIVKMKYINRPLMDIYWIRKEDIIKFINQNGGEILSIEENQRAGKHFISYNYFVRKCECI